MGNFGGVFKSGNKRCQGIKGGLWLGKGISFLFLTATMPPKPTLLFRPESNEEADKAILEVEDMKVQLPHLNTGLVEFNRKAEAARAPKAEQQWEQQWLANEQAQKDQRIEAKEKLARERQEQLAELARVSPSIRNSAFNLANSWSGSCEGDSGAGGWAFLAQN